MFKLVLIFTALISNFNSLDYQILEKRILSHYLSENEIQTLKIPFTPQAPFGEWEDERQQDGCEEASVLMVYSWIKNQQLTLAKAKELIINISEYEEKEFGNFVDTSIQDTAEQILKGYFGYTNFEIKKNITRNDLIFEIAAGNALIIPVNGQLLQNPNFTPPGPERHMLVVKGYDQETREFITNDPGTKMGESYRYNASLLYEAITDYPTGNHLPIEKIEKVMLVVKK